jgi:hypothetical protein
MSSFGSVRRGAWDEKNLVGPSRQDVVPLIRRIRHLERCTKVEVECLALAKQVLPTPPARVGNRLYYHDRPNITVSEPATIIRPAERKLLQWVRARVPIVPSDHAIQFELNDAATPRATLANTVLALREGLGIECRRNEQGSVCIGDRLIGPNIRWVLADLLQLRHGFKPRRDTIINALDQLVR